MASGWRFKVALDAQSCPVAALGLTYSPTVAKSSFPNNLTELMGPEDMFFAEAGDGVAESGDIVEEAQRLMV